MSEISVDICICTFRREHVADTIASLLALEFPAPLTPAILVMDNDVTDTARSAVERLAAESRFPITYIHAPSRNISIARNAGLDASHADWVAFIDDDELAKPDWLAALWRAAESKKADVVFGAVNGIYRDGTPDWIRALDMHNPLPYSGDGSVETGYSSNVLMRWSGSAWNDQRFELSLGRTGGEDTEFFYRVGRLGADMTVAEDAIVEETIEPDRATLKYLTRRRFSAGHSYAVSMLQERRGRRAGIVAMAGLKAAFSFLATPFSILSPARWRFWLLRGVFHSGVVASSLKLRRAEHYG
ncbi:MAG: glycosyltransferase family 2 protein [Paracoccaceae bacterium]